MPVWVLSGGNRGLGLEFVRQLSQDHNNFIIATVRTGNTDLKDLKPFLSGRIHSLVCDTSSEDSIKTFASEASALLSGRKIDYLLNVAGVNVESSQNSLLLTQQALHDNLAVNVMGPAWVTKYLYELDTLAPAVRVMNMTSGLGSMSKHETINPHKCLPYSISKISLNMLNMFHAQDLKPKCPEVIAIVMDPGWVKTAIGGEGAIMEPEDSIGGMLKVLYGLTAGDSGKFYNWDGTNEGW